VGAYTLLFSFERRVDMNIYNLLHLYRHVILIKYKY
jgi:hypothetical protein